MIILDPKGNRNTVPCRIRKTEDDNVYRCEYVAQTTGMHSVNVFFAGQQIPKSPFGVKVTPGKQTLDLITALCSGIISLGLIYLCCRHVFTKKCIAHTWFFHQHLLKSDATPKCDNSYEDLTEEHILTKWPDLMYHRIENLELAAIPQRIYYALILTLLNLNTVFKTSISTTKCHPNLTLISTNKLT